MENVFNKLKNFCRKDKQDCSSDKTKQIRLILKFL